MPKAATTKRGGKEVKKRGKKGKSDLINATHLYYDEANMHQTPTLPSVVSLPTCSSPMSSVRMSVRRTLVSPSARSASFSVSAGRPSTTSSVPHMRPRLLPTRSATRMRSRLTTYETREMLKLTIEADELFVGPG